MASKATSQPTLEIIEQATQIKCIEMEPTRARYKKSERIIYEIKLDFLLCASSGSVFSSVEWVKKNPVGLRRRVLALSASAQEVFSGFFSMLKRVNTIFGYIYGISISIKNFPLNSHLPSALVSTLYRAFGLDKSSVRSHVFNYIWAHRRTHMSSLSFCESLKFLCLVSTFDIRLEQYEKEWIWSYFCLASCSIEQVRVGMSIYWTYEEEQQSMWRFYWYALVLPFCVTSLVYSYIYICSSMIPFQLCSCPGITLPFAGDV